MALSFPLDSTKYSLDKVTDTLVCLAQKDPEKLLKEIPTLKTIKTKQRVALIVMALKTTPSVHTIILDSIDDFGFKKKGKKVSVIAKLILLNIEQINPFLPKEDLSKLITRINKKDMTAILPSFSKERFLLIGAIIANNPGADRAAWLESFENNDHLTDEEKNDFRTKFVEKSIEGSVEDAGF